MEILATSDQLVLLVLGLYLNFGPEGNSSVLLVELRIFVFAHLFSGNTSFVYVNAHVFFCFY